MTMQNTRTPTPKIIMRENRSDITHHHVHNLEIWNDGMIYGSSH